VTCFLFFAARYRTIRQYAPERGGIDKQKVLVVIMIHVLFCSSRFCRVLVAVMVADWYCIAASKMDKAALQGFSSPSHKLGIYC
jgi:hypothetical protein